MSGDLAICEAVFCIAQPFSLALFFRFRSNSVRHAACMSLRVILGPKNMNCLARELRRYSVGNSILPD